MDYPTPANGKRNSFWGTLHVCPDCGRCLCFACHPDGPCLDQRDEAGRQRPEPALRPLSTVYFSVLNR